VELFFICSPLMWHRSARANEPDLFSVVKMNDNNQCTAVGLTD